METPDIGRLNYNDNYFEKPHYLKHLQDDLKEISLDNVVAGLVKLDLQPGHSFLMLNAETGLANQLAAHLIGPGGVNIGARAPFPPQSFAPDHCRFLTGVIRRANPAWESTATLPVFTERDFSARLYHRILLLGHFPNEAEQQRMQHLLTVDGLIVCTGFEEDNHELTVHLTERRTAAAPATPAAPTKKLRTSPAGRRPLESLQAAGIRHRFLSCRWRSWHRQ